jgi:hypothetical protein
MLCFLMALKSRAVSKDWEKVSRLFENTLRSAYHQTHPDFKVIVVCHETPHLSQHYDDRVEIINVDFPPPVQPITELTMQDKWGKLAIGMIRVGELNPDFLMIMDADDLVSNRLSEFVHAHPDANGWALKQGYTYNDGDRWIYCNDHFSCGSDAIVSGRLIQFPKDLTAESVNNCIVLRWGHTIIAEKLAELGKPLMPLPFLGATQVVNHGDNDSHAPSKEQWHSLRFFLGKIRRTRFLTQKIRREFSIF